jgi:hypothetical protein
VDIGETITVGAVYVCAIIVTWVWMGLTCEVIVATEPAGFWSVVWLGELDMPGRLQAERTAASERHIDRSLNVFNFAFVIAMKELKWHCSICTSLLITAIRVCHVNHIQNTPPPHPSTGECFSPPLGRYTFLKKCRREIEQESALELLGRSVGPSNHCRRHLR